LDGSAERVTIIADIGFTSSLEAAGFRRVLRWRRGEAVACGRESAFLRRDAVAMSFGRRTCPEGGSFLDHASVLPLMDPRDRGAPSCGPEAKAALAWSPLLRHPELWRRSDLPPRIVQMMTEGVVIDTVGDDEIWSQEIGQYAFKDVEHFVMGSQECDRALLAGHLEIVPEREVDWALSNGSVHPWTVVHQAADKWRSCQDYKGGTNPRVISRPFTLCSASEVKRVVKPDTHFAKYDLRDGFWSVPVATHSRHHLMVRHPATGRLLRCTSLPFGYSRSPEHFCDVTESVAQLFRERVAGRGIYIFVFVDDFLICGDTRQQTIEGMKTFEALLRELGLPFATHKTRGPTRVIEFLGFLLSNVAHARCMALTAKRQESLERLLSEWSAFEPAPGRPPETADPRELASFLGQLVFASEVIPGGRVYMQSMLRQFKGLEVDWTRGLVRHLHSAWRRIQILEGFWRDVHWWRSALRRQNCVKFDSPTVGEIAIVGTDASDLACGELIWIDGAREEIVLVFTHAERRRPINFRELLGTLRALEAWGPRLTGRLVLVETDNTFGHETVKKLHCKSEDSQELVRRIHHLSLKHGFVIKSVHTPGIMLKRPDGTSRGATPAEPRLRARLTEFKGLESRFGPFDEYLGSEREHAAVAGGARQLFPRLWAHPDYDTVGSTLRLVCERLTLDTRTCPRGVVVVPFAPEAGWWKLVKHFACVGRWEPGHMQLEANALGVWVPTTNVRPTLLLAFPRAGATLMPLRDAVMMGGVEARAEIELNQSGLAAGAFDRISNSWVNPVSALPRGTLLYSARRATPSELRPHSGRSLPGTLYLTTEPFDGTGRPLCAELRRGISGHRHHFWLDGGSYSRHKVPWAPDVCSLWVVNHLGGETRDQPAAARGTTASSRVRYLFDFERAEDEIMQMRGHRASVDAAAEAQWAEMATTTIAVRLANAEPDITTRRPARAATPSSYTTACLMVLGLSSESGRPEIILGKHAGTGLWMVLGGNRDTVRDEDGSDTSAREFCEELFGMDGDTALSTGRRLVDDGIRRGAFTGPYGRPGAPNQAFLLVLEDGDIDVLASQFVESAEVSEVIRVPASMLRGRSTTLEWETGHELKLRDFLGHLRIEAVRAIAARGCRAASPPPPPPPPPPPAMMSTPVGARGPARPLPGIYEVLDLGTSPSSSADVIEAAGTTDEDVDDEDLVPMSGYEAFVVNPSPLSAMRPLALSPADSPERQAALRNASRNATPRPAAGVTQAQRCQYAAMRCIGCLQELGLRTWVIPGGSGMVHNTMECYQAAAAKRIELEANEFEGEAERRRREARDSEGPPIHLEGPYTPADGDEFAASRGTAQEDIVFVAKPPKPEINLRGTQLTESLSDARRDMVRACMAGTCPYADSDEPRMTCMGSCHRQIHGVRCAQISQGHAIIGVFECPDCQLGKVFGHDGPYPEGIRRDAEETMLLTLSRGAEQTGAGYSDFVKLQTEWATANADGGGTIRLPVDCDASLKLFLTWIVRQKHRPRSLPALWRVAGSYMIRTGRPNITMGKSDVRAHYSSLLEEHGVEAEPRTSATPRMISFLFASVLTKHCPAPLVRARTALSTCLEAGCGMRVGEALTGGDYHGLRATNLVILRRLDDGLVTVEAVLEHSKTKFKRFANCLGTTLGKAALPFQATVREYWREVGFKTVSWIEGGYEVTGVDYYVIRISFLGMTAEKFAQLIALFSASLMPEIRIAAASLAERARKRYLAANSKDKRYINVFGSHRSDPRMGLVSRELTEAGFGERRPEGGVAQPGFATIVPGPLLRSTDGKRISHMPVDPSSTYGTLHKMFDEAYVLSNPDGDPDPWIDLQGLDEPLWGHHSLRRLADTVARATMHRTGVDESDIDLTFGWQEMMYSRKMQYHYESRFNRDKRYRVTMYL